jgi:hypothetical protein
MSPIARQVAAESIHAVDEDRARIALVALLDFAVHTAIYADETTLHRITAAIEALHAYIGFPMPAGAAMRQFSCLLDAGWRPNPNEWPDHAEL